MTAQDFTYQDGARSLLGYLAYDDAKSEKRPGVLLFHDAMGLGPHTMGNARRLASLGYVAVAADMYGGRGYATKREELGALVGPLAATPNGIVTRANAALKALLAQPQVDPNRIAAIGYCFGGLTVLEMARSGAALKGVVSFHGTLTTQNPAKPGAVKAKVLVLTGDEDPFAPAEHVAGLQAEMKAAGANWQVVVYGGAQHAFAMPDSEAMDMPGIKYDKLTDQRSWAAMLAFFDEIFA